MKAQRGVFSIVLALTALALCSSAQAQASPPFMPCSGANLVDQQLHTRLVVRVPGPPLFLVDDQYVAWIRLSHDFYGMCGNDALPKSRTSQPE